LIMDTLNITLESKPVATASIPVIDDSNVRLEIQKLKNEIKVLKIRFRKLPMQSPLRQEMLDNIEKLMQHQADLETELNATH
jgi:hypothetical protein